jgi:hypothetical protein
VWLGRKRIGEYVEVEARPATKPVKDLGSAWQMAGEKCALAFDAFVLALLRSAISRTTIAPLARHLSKGPSFDTFLA